MARMLGLLHYWFSNERQYTVQHLGEALIIVLCELALNGKNKLITISTWVWFALSHETMKQPWIYITPIIAPIQTAKPVAQEGSDKLELLYMYTHWNEVMARLMISVLTLRYQLSNHAVCQVSQLSSLLHHMTDCEEGLCWVSLMLHHCTPQLGGFVVRGHVGCFQFIFYMVAKDPLTEELISQPQWISSRLSQACKIQPKDSFRVYRLWSGSCTIE